MLTAVGSNKEPQEGAGPTCAVLLSSGMDHTCPGLGPSGEPKAPGLELAVYGAHWTPPWAVHSGPQQQSWALVGVEDTCVCEQSPPGI